MEARVGAGTLATDSGRIKTSCSRFPQLDGAGVRSSSSRRCGDGGRQQFGMSSSCRACRTRRRGAKVLRELCASRLDRPMCTRQSLRPNLGTVAVAQLVRASDCGSEGRGFKSRQPPHFARTIARGLATREASLRERSVPLRERVLPLHERFLPLRELVLPLRERFLPLRERFLPLRERGTPNRSRRRGSSLAVAVPFAGRTGRIRTERAAPAVAPGR